MNTHPLFAVAFSVTFLPAAHGPLPVTFPASAGSARPRTYGAFAACSLFHAVISAFDAVPAAILSASSA